MPSLLVIDDDRSVVPLIRSACKHLDVEVLSADSAEDGMKLVKNKQPDVLLLDVVLPGITGLELFEQIRKIDERLPVVFMTASGESDTAIEAMKMGALDYLMKPLDVERITAVVAQALEIRRLMKEPVELPKPGVGNSEMIGRSLPMLEVYKDVGRVAPQTVTVLIRGESGTGKELIARAIYQHSDRRGKPFLAVNCAALTETLLESELFGHEKGSFTGADHRRIGKFEQCNGGTIFLDEVGDMPPLMQAKLLRMLQEQRFERVGGNETIKTDVRIIAATNRELEAMTAAGTFRPDLYYRLNGFTIKVPPLRERGDDLLLLIEALLLRYSDELGKSLQRVSPEALKVLLEYPWPGNVRELQSMLRKALLNLTGPVLVPEFLPEEIREYTPAAAGANGDGGGDGIASDLSSLVTARLHSGSENLYAEALEFMERYVVTRVLQNTSGNQSKAAKVLGITRGSLRNKTHGLGIKIGQVVSSGEPEEDSTEEET